MSSISNETDPDGRTKIVTILNIKLPHRDVIDELQVKVDDGAEATYFTFRFFQVNVSPCTGMKKATQEKDSSKDPEQILNVMMMGD